MARKKVSRKATESLSCHEAPAILKSAVTEERRLVRAGAQGTSLLLPAEPGQRREDGQPQPSAQKPGEVIQGTYCEGKEGSPARAVSPEAAPPVTWSVPASAQCTPPGHQQTWQQELCAGENLGAVAPGASRQREQPRCSTQACLTGQRLPGAEGGPAQALPRPCSAGSQGQSRLHRAGACPLAD